LKGAYQVIAAERNSGVGMCK